MSSSREVKEIRNDAGELVASFEYVDGKLDGVERLWINGTLVMEMQHVNGQPHGEYKAWWDNGVPKQEGQFAHGKPIGKFRFYDETGELTEERHLDLPSNTSLERTRER